ncbi:hypothetical protein [Desemzia sp. FAM 23990]|uniref:hypothetical protein n=1 Tax=Desemzia sp. FAM 23990 TaxID=3259520 RepID=UPI0038878DD8
MSKHSWHITRKGEEPNVVRHYKWLTKMYLFILRNPSMFGERKLTVYDNCKKVADISWREVVEQVNSGIKEGEARKLLKEAGEKS